MTFGVLSVLGGAVYRGTNSAQPPLSATNTLAIGWELVGKYSSDGFTMERDRSTEQVRDQNGEIAKEVVTGSGLTYQLTFIETTPTVLELYYADSLDDQDGQIIVPAAMGTRAPLVIDVIMADANGDILIERHYLPVAQVSETESRTLQVGQVSNYPMTFRAFPSDELVNARGIAGSARILRGKRTEVGVDPSSTKVTPKK